MTNPDELDPAQAARLRAAVQRLPAEVEPERDLWPAIRARIEEGRVQALPGASAGAAADARAGDADARALPWYARPRRLAAAAVLLVSLTATGTWWVMHAGAPVAMTADPGAVAPLDPSRDPSAALVSFASYERSAGELAAQLEGRRARLDPATLAVLERTLRTIDEAIAEARAALAADPGNAAVQGFVVTAYRQKIDFLRRANDVAAEVGS